MAKRKLTEAEEEDVKTLYGGYDESLEELAAEVKQKFIEINEVREEVEKAQAPYDKVSNKYRALLKEYEDVRAKLIQHIIK